MAPAGLAQVAACALLGLPEKIVDHINNLPGIDVHQQDIAIIADPAILAISRGKAIGPGVVDPETAGEKRCAQREADAQAAIVPAAHRRVVAPDIEEGAVLVAPAIPVIAPIVAPSPIPASSPTVPPPPVPIATVPAPIGPTAPIPFAPIPVAAVVAIITAGVAPGCTEIAAVIPAIAAAISQVSALVAAEILAIIAPVGAEFGPRHDAVAEILPICAALLAEVAQITALLAAQILSVAAAFLTEILPVGTAFLTELARRIDPRGADGVAILPAELAAATAALAAKLAAPPASFSLLCRRLEPRCHGDSGCGRLDRQVGGFGPVRR